MDKINFQNLPSQTTPVNATNLNQLQTNVENDIKAIDTLRLNGTTIPENSDLDNYTTAGIYYSSTATISASLSNTPVTAAAFKMVVEYLHATTRLRQTIYVNNTTSDTYVRTFSSSGSWGRWENNIYNNNIQAGTSSLINVAAGTYVDTTIVFPIQYSSTPIVVGNLRGTAQSVDNGNTLLSIFSKNSKQVVFRYYNKSTTDRAMYIDWIAYGT